MASRRCRCRGRPSAASVRERLDVIGVALLGLDVARPLLGLHRKPRRLLLGVVQLAEGVAELHAADEVLEALDDLRVVVGHARERRELDRLVVEDRRLDQPRLDERGDRLVDELRPRLVARRCRHRGPSAAAQLVGVARPEPARASASTNRIRCHGAFRSISCPRKMTFVVPSASSATFSTSSPCAHRVLVVGVRLVPLEHRELRVVLVRDALVAKVLPIS